MTVRNIVNDLPAPPAALATPLSGVNIGASHLKKTPSPLDTLAIAPPSIPNPVNNGPSATAKAPTFKINCCWPSFKSLNQLMTPFTLPTMPVNTSPNLTPYCSALSPIPSIVSVKSNLNRFNFEKKPFPSSPQSRNAAPTLPTAAQTFANAAVNDFSPIILAAPPILFSMASLNISADISPFDAMSKTASSDTTASFASHWYTGKPLSDNCFKLLL